MNRIMKGFFHAFTAIMMVLVTFLIACSKEEDTSGTALSGSAIKGPVKNGLVEVFLLNDNGTYGSQVGQGITDETGKFQVTLAGEYPDSVLAIVITMGSYVDEATGDEIIMQEGETMECIFRTRSEGIVVTPLTTIASNRIRQEGTEQLDEIYQDLAAELNLTDQETGETIDLTQVIPTDLTDDTTDDESASETRYAFVLAGLTEYASDASVTALEITKQLAEDYANNENFSETGKELLQGIETGIADFAIGERNKSGVTNPNITMGDLVAPILQSLSINSASLKAGDIGTIALKIFDPGIGYGWHHLYVTTSDEKTILIKPFNVVEDGNPISFDSQFEIFNYYAEGTWKISEVTLCDELDNCNEYSISETSETVKYQFVKIDSEYLPSESDIDIVQFQVTETEVDTEAPEITQIALLNEVSVVGDTLKIQISTTEAIAPVVNFFGWIKSPSGGLVYCKGEWIDEQLILPLPITTYIESGEWEIDSLYLIDAALNYNVYLYNEDSPTVYVDDKKNPTTLDLYSFNLSITDSTPDTTFPAIQSITVSSQTATSSDTILFSIQLEDASEAEANSIQQIIYLWTSPNNGQQYDSSWLTYNATTQTFEAELQLNTYFEEGEWNLTYVKILDKAGHLTRYFLDPLKSEINYVMEHALQNYPGTDLIYDLTNIENAANMYIFHSVATDPVETALSSVSILKN